MSEKKSVLRPSPLDRRIARFRCASDRYAVTFAAPFAMVIPSGSRPRDSPRMSKRPRLQTAVEERDLLVRTVAESQRQEERQHAGTLTPRRTRQRDDDTLLTISIADGRENNGIAQPFDLRDDFRRTLHIGQKPEEGSISWVVTSERDRGAAQAIEKRQRRFPSDATAGRRQRPSSDPLSPGSLSPVPSVPSISEASFFFNLFGSLDSTKPS